MSRLIWVLTMVMVFAAGCLPAQKPVVVTNKGFTYADIWDAALKAVRHYLAEIDSADKASGKITTEYYIDNAKSTITDEYARQASLEIVARADSADLLINVGIYHRDRKPQYLPREGWAFLRWDAEMQKAIASQYEEYRAAAIARKQRKKETEKKAEWWKR